MMKKRVVALVAVVVERAVVEVASLLALEVVVVDVKMVVQVIAHGMHGNNKTILHKGVQYLHTLMK